ncbi:MAG: hypothetical protein SGPRY_007750, partial [Prymnesium sp.]
PRDWRETARNARALLDVYLSVFRARKPDSQGGKGVVAAAGAAGDRINDKPPADSHEVVEAASKAADRQLALPADLLQGVTSDPAAAPQNEKDRQLSGEIIRYLVDQYGQGAAAYLTLNGMSVGYGVPTALWQE